MRVKIGNQWHDSNVEPICIQISAGEQQQIADIDRSMATNGKYAIFPSAWSKQQAIQWMQGGEQATGLVELAGILEDRGPLAAIAAERRRQVEQEGWTPEHDDYHTGGDLAKAAAAYALSACSDRDHAAAQRLAEMMIAPNMWPWCSTWWKPKSRRLDLVKAGALIVAELDRLNRAEERQRGES